MGAFASGFGVGVGSGGLGVAVGSTGLGVAVGTAVGDGVGPQLAKIKLTTSKAVQKPTVFTLVNMGSPPSTKSGL